MNFAPKTEDEIASMNLWPDGEYDFEVAKSKDETSAAGNAMIHLTLTVFEGSGSWKFVDDYLLGTDGSAYKLRHFCESVGLLARYEAGTLTAEECVGRSGKLKLNTTKDKSGKYPDKNGVRDYVFDREARPQVVARPANNPKAEPLELKHGSKGSALKVAPGAAVEESDDVPF